MSLDKCDFIEVVKILEEREECKVIQKDKGEKIIFCSEDNTELDLCIYRLDNKFLIRRVSFKNKGTGTFKILFEWFCDYCSAKGYRCIIIESIVSEDMLSFALKNNLEPIPGKTFKDGDTLWGDYEHILTY